MLIYHIFYLIQTPLHKAALKGSVECVNALLRHGADLTTTDVKSRDACCFCACFLYTKQDMCKLCVIC